MRIELVILGLLVLFVSCTQENHVIIAGDDSEMSYVLQAFAQDQYKSEKLKNAGISYVVGNMRLVKHLKINNMSVKKYMIATDCGGCSAYNIIKLSNKKTIAFPVNFDFIIRSYHSLTKDSLNPCNEIHRNELNLAIQNIADAINMFFLEENTVIDSIDIEEANVVLKALFSQCLFSNSMIESDSSDHGNFINHRIGASKVKFLERSFEYDVNAKYLYYFIPESIIRVKLYNEESREVKIVVLNPEGYKNINF